MLGGLALELRRDRFGERAYGQSGDLLLSPMLLNR